MKIEVTQAMADAFREITEQITPSGLLVASDAEPKLAKMIEPHRWAHEDIPTALLRIIENWKHNNKIVAGMNNQPTLKAISRAVNAEAQTQAMQVELTRAVENLGKAQSLIHQLQEELRKAKEPRSEEDHGPKMKQLEGGMILEAEVSHEVPMLSEGDSYGG